MVGGPEVRDRVRPAVRAGHDVVRAVRDFEGDIEGLVHIVFPALFGLVMGYFGVSSFLRARKISRS